MGPYPSSPETPMYFRDTESQVLSHTLRSRRRSPNPCSPNIAEHVSVSLRRARSLRCQPLVGKEEPCDQFRGRRNRRKWESDLWDSGMEIQFQELTQGPRCEDEDPTGVIASNRSYGIDCKPCWSAFSRTCTQQGQGTDG